MYKDLSKVEKRRVRDAVYRLRKIGFVIPEEAYTALKETSTSENAQTYGQIEARVTRFKNVHYKSRKGKGAEVSGRVAYQALKAARKRNIERTRIQPGGALSYSASIPKAKIENIGSWEASVKQQEESFRKLAKSFREPAEHFIKRRYQTGINNLTKAIGVLVQNDNKLYNLIIDKIKAMSASELGEFLKKNGNTLESIIWKYPIDSDLLSYATVSAQSNIFTLFEILHIDPDNTPPTQPLYKNLRDQIEDQIANGQAL